MMTIFVFFRPFLLQINSITFKTKAMSVYLSHCFFCVCVSASPLFACVDLRRHCFCLYLLYCFLHVCIWVTVFACVYLFCFFACVYFRHSLLRVIICITIFAHMYLRHCFLCFLFVCVFTSLFLRVLFLSMCLCVSVSVSLSVLHISLFSVSLSVATCSTRGKHEATMTVVSICRSSEARTIFRNLHSFAIFHQLW